MSGKVTGMSSPSMRVVPHPDGVVIEVVADADAVAVRSADRLAALVREKPDAVVAFPTGRTPVRLYDELKRRVAAGELDLSNLVVFQLDEFIGLPEDHPGAFAGWLERVLLEPVGIPTERFHRIPAHADDLAAAAQEFEARLEAAGGLDLAILGIGENGHVAFNEPGSPPDSRTRVLQLTEQSIQQSQADWPADDEVPPTAMTMGIATLCSAKRLLMMVTGEGKAEILRRALTEAPTLDVPASLLRSAGERFVIVTDEAAAAELA